jgi:hypothetical protein
LGADGMPDNLIKESLKQPNHIKIFLEKRAKEITGQVTPDQAWFGVEYFLAFTLPNPSQRFWLDFWQKRRTVVHYCLT